jgi:hypothetical protein
MTWLLALTLAASPDAPPPVPTMVDGLVVDQDGKPVGQVALEFYDTTRLAPGRHAGGCGTVHPSFAANSDDQGRIHVQLPFKPTQVQVEGKPDDVDAPPGLVAVPDGQPLELKLHRGSFFDADGTVVDGSGAPLANVHLNTNEVATTTGEDGRFHLRLRHDRDSTVRVRKIGFKPVTLDADKLVKIILTEKRPLVTVKVVDPQTRQPARYASVALWRGNERLSYCTAGDPTITHEPNPGECTLDAEPGELELRVYQSKRTLKIGASDSSLTIEEQEPPPPAFDSRY